MIECLYKYKLNSNQLQNIQNISLFIISCYSFCLYLCYNISSLCYDKNVCLVVFIRHFDILLKIVGFHAITDFFITKSYDVKIHHICVSGIIFYNNYYNISPEHKIIFYPLLLTEISSIFYVLKYWLPKKTILYNVNDMLFYISFFKLRIYDFYYKIIYNNISFNTIFHTYSHSNYSLSLILLISCYGLYILNLYWFLIMNKIIYKQIQKIKNIDTDILCHKLCSYLLWLNIPLALYIYVHKPNEKYMFDMIGITCLSISSYLYHDDIYKRLYNKQIEEYNIPNKDNFLLFINDTITINARSFLVIVTNYYNNKYLLYILLISGIFHLNSIYYCIINIFELLLHHDKSKDTFLNYHNIFSIIPISFDVFLICMNSQTEILIPYFLLNIIIGLLFIINPFYKLTHVSFHILLVAQNYYMCLSNTR